MGEFDLAYYLLVMGRYMFSRSLMLSMLVMSFMIITVPCV